DAYGYRSETYRCLLGDEPEQRSARLTLHAQLDARCRGVSQRRHDTTCAVSRAIALPKAGGGIRPIAIGPTFTKLAHNIALTRTLPAEQRFIVGRHQFAVAYPNGMAAAVNLMRLLINEHQGDAEPWCLLASDARNAHNSVSRAAIARRLARTLP